MQGILTKKTAKRNWPRTWTEAARFLTALDPEAKAFTFQTFDDEQERKDTKLVGCCTAR